MSALVFVDTSIFVYARDALETSKREMATQWITRLWQEQTGRTSAQVLSEYYVTVTRKLKPGISAGVWYSQFQNARKRYIKSVSALLTEISRPESLSVFL